MALFKFEKIISQTAKLKIPPIILRIQYIIPVNKFRADIHSESRIFLYCSNQLCCLMRLHVPIISTPIHTCVLNTKLNPSRVMAIAQGKIYIIDAFYNFHYLTTLADTHNIHTINFKLVIHHKQFMLLALLILKG